MGFSIRVYSREKRGISKENNSGGWELFNAKLNFIAFFPAHINILLARGSLDLMTKRTFIILTVTAIILKALLFSFAALKAPGSKFRNDTRTYLETGRALVSRGVFGKVNEDGTIAFESYRTPGYPLFLGVTHGTMKIPLSGVILIQVLLTLCAAVIVFKAAGRIDPRLAPLAFFIMLFDPSITVFSLMLLTESLFLLCVSIFIYAGIAYLQEQKKAYLFLTALTLAAATYIRPISFYLAAPVAVFLVAAGRKNIKKSVIHACIFLLVAQGLLLPWQWRNYRHSREFRFSRIENATVGHEGLYKSYARNRDPYTQGMPPFAYYTNVTFRSSGFFRCGKIPAFFFFG
jgi:4-amino-4-deoxy-L-arabinose transferase-like glycosyltransferase